MVSMLAVRGVAVGMRAPSIGVSRGTSTVLMTSHMRIMMYPTCSVHLRHIRRLQIVREPLLLHMMVFIFADLNQIWLVTCRR